jgi:hypothetical protein
MVGEGGEEGNAVDFILFTKENNKLSYIIRFIFNSTSVTPSLLAYFLLEIILWFVYKPLQPLKQLIFTKTEGHFSVYASGS